MIQTKVRRIDGDGHVIEDARKVLEHMEAPYRNWYAASRTGNVFLVPSDGAPRGLGDKFRTGAGNSTESWLTMMQEGDLERAILYPTSGLFEGFLKDPDYAVAYSRAYNNWLAKEVLKPAQGLLGVALLPVQDQEEAAKELRRAKQELGLVGAMLPADGGHLLGHRRYDP